MSTSEKELIFSPSDKKLHAIGSIASAATNALPVWCHDKSSVIEGTMKLYKWLIPTVLSCMLSVPAAAQSAASAPDVVVLKDGSMMRGTISELKKGQSVTILLITGETRTIPMVEVEYAGGDRPGKDSLPSSSDRPRETPFTLQSQPAGPTHTSLLEHPAETPFTFQSQPSGLTLQLHTGSGTAVGSSGRHSVFVKSESYSTICISPCQASLPAGTYRLALSEGQGSPIEPDHPVTIPAQPFGLHGEYKSYTGMRIVGWVVLVGSMIAGTALALTPSTKEECDSHGCDKTREYVGPRFYAGLGIMVGGSILGLILGLKSDAAEVQVLPAGP